eukprot:Sspe_Gene.102079::Locus_76831_Transcript_1_1_Confidence_1.000_Length_625::g.102079::m.102079
MQSLHFQRQSMGGRTTGERGGWGPKKQMTEKHGAAGVAGVVVWGKEQLTFPTPCGSGPQGAREEGLDEERGQTTERGVKDNLGILQEGEQGTFHLFFLGGGGWGGVGRVLSHIP